MTSTYKAANSHYANAGERVSFYQSLLITLNWIAEQGDLRIVTLAKSDESDFGKSNNERGDYLIEMDSETVAAVYLAYNTALIYLTDDRHEARAINPDTLRGRLAPAVQGLQKPPVEEKPSPSVRIEANWFIVIRTPSMHGGTNVHTFQGTVFEGSKLESAFEAIIGELTAARAKQRLNHSGTQAQES